jgi:DegV family protein with EDD domain
MPVKIVTDCVSDILPPVAEEFGITVIPLNVVFGNEIYRDGVDLTTEDFYRRLEGSQILPTTSTPSLQAFIELYEKLAGETDEILVITISRKLSATGEVFPFGQERSRNKAMQNLYNFITGYARIEGLAV